MQTLPATAPPSLSPPWHHGNHPATLAPSLTSLPTAWEQPNLLPPPGTPSTPHIKPGGIALVSQSPSIFLPPPPPRLFLWLLSSLAVGRGGLSCIRLAAKPLSPRGH